jgi:hypothetical protein
VETNLKYETPVRDVELAGSCIACGGAVSARFTPGSALGVCVACHLVTPMAMVREGGGVRVFQWPVGVA